MRFVSKIKPTLQVNNFEKIVLILISKLKMAFYSSTCNLKVNSGVKMYQRACMVEKVASVNSRD